MTEPANTDTDRLQAETERLQAEVQELREAKRVLAQRVSIHERALADAQATHAANRCKSESAFTYWVIDDQDSSDVWKRLRKSFAYGAGTVIGLSAFGERAGDARRHLLSTHDAELVDNYALVADMRWASESVSHELDCDLKAVGASNKLKGARTSKSKSLGAR